MWVYLQGNDEEKAIGRSILVEVLEALRIAAVMLSPVTPTLSEAIYLQLGYSTDQFQGLKLEDSKWGGKARLHLTSGFAKHYLFSK